MNWFFDWWNSLGMLQQVFACFAVPATVILVIQTLLLVFGLGGHAADNGEIDHDFSHDISHDVSHDIDHDVSHDFSHDVHDVGHDDAHDMAHHGAGVRLFTIRGFVAFFAIGGWLGIALLDSGVNVTISVLVAFLGGIAALLLVALAIKLMCDMQENGTIQIENAIAKTGKVYLHIPPHRSGYGKINVTVQGTYTEMDAVTDSKDEIKTGTMVQVISVTADNVLVVRPLGNDKNAAVEK